MQDFFRIFGEAVIDPEEESFLAFSQPIPSQSLGFVNSGCSTLEIAVAGRSLTIHQSPTILSSNREGGTTGAVLWRITPIIANWISSSQNAFFQHAILKPDSVVLELGCGVSGVLALALAPKIGKYFATDQEYVLRLLNRNIEENTPERADTSNDGDGKRSAGNKRSRKYATASSSSLQHHPTIGKIETMTLDWELTSVSTLPTLLHDTSTKADHLPGLDAIVACDCIYNESLIPPFVQTCADLCALREYPSFNQMNPTICIIAQQLRSPDVFEAWLSAFCEKFRTKMPQVKIQKRSASPAPTPSKRTKKEGDSRYIPMTRVSPIVIEYGSDGEITDSDDSPLSSLEKEVAEFDKLIKETNRLHKIQHGKREAAEDALALKHAQEEQAEKVETKRLNSLRAKAVSRLNSHLRSSIVGSRMLPSRVVASVAVPIKREQNREDSSGVSLVSPPASSVPTSSNTRSTSLVSPSNELSVNSSLANNQRIDLRSSRRVKKEEMEAEAEGYAFVHNQDSEDDDYVDVDARGVGTLMDPAHSIWRMAGSGRRNLGEIKEPETSEDSDSEVVNDGHRSGTTNVGRVGRKRRLTKGQLATVPRIEMPNYILSLNNDYHTKLPLPETSVKFSRKFLTMFLGGNLQETYVKISQKRLEQEQVYPISRYYCFCPSYNPQVPPSAGRHGAGLSVGGPDLSPDDGMDGLQECVSYFIKRRETEWEYCGEYVQGRRYEKLRPDEIETHVREETKQHWAEKITIKGWGVRLLVSYGAARDENHAKTFTVQQVKKLFDKPDDAPGAKLRFYWQYMECCDYNLDFYEALSRKGLEIGWTTRSDLTKENNFGLNAAMPTAVLEDWSRELASESEE
ncbi:hypothetical protein FGG08_006672 [Glutinoglossum americanum]|uniref:DUF6697 domain-containing protein n=1 Tax=Glutinoglossum americanum TaxID=1670608 RepID=A0A9P8HS73_9PEZI|nr:hypothetical protein FGG08_006672 [Glutinoglossum americanum]